VSLQILKYNNLSLSRCVGGVMELHSYVSVLIVTLRLKRHKTHFSFRNVTHRSYPSVDAVTIATFPFNLPLYAMFDCGRPMMNLLKTVLSIMI
jgi:hypothetical protein